MSSRPGLRIELPDGFVVLDAADPAQVDVRDLPEQLAGWCAQVVAARTSAGAELLALQVEPSPDDPERLTALSLAVHLLPLEPAPVEVVVQGLRALALALARTTPSGQVSVLDLPAGPAVGAADLVPHDGVPAALVTLQLPLPRIGQLLTLTLCTPDDVRLPACAAVAAAVGARVRLDTPEVAA